MAAAKDLVQRQVKAGKPFLCWGNTTRMQLRPQVKSEHRGLLEGTVREASGAGRA